MQLAAIGIWKIVAHIAFKFELVASETFSTASTLKVSGHRRLDGGRPLERIIRKRGNGSNLLLRVVSIY